LLVLIFWEHLINLIVLTPIAFKSRSEFSKIKPKDTLLFILVGFGASAMGLICFSAAFKYINNRNSCNFTKNAAHNNRNSRSTGYQRKSHSQIYHMGLALNSLRVHNFT
jgi:hypothetical protein